MPCAAVAIGRRAAADPTSKNSRRLIPSVSSVRPAGLDHCLIAILLEARFGSNALPMNRYFPELIAPLAATLSERCVVDGEIVIVGVGGLDFETLLLRIHPAASRVKLLSAQAPASLVAWDLLALGDEDLCNVPLVVRRERLEHVLAGAAPPVHLSPATRDRALAADWFRPSRAPGSMVSWQSVSTRPIAPGNAR